MLDNDAAAVETELVVIHAAVLGVTESFVELSTSRYAEIHVSPITWGKTVAKFTGPWREGVPGMSGAATPIIHALDIFIGRSSYSSPLGKEVLYLRRWLPPNWKSFFLALESVSVRDFVAAFLASPDNGAGLHVNHWSGARVRMLV